MQTLTFGDYSFFCDEKTLKLTDEETLKVFSSPISVPKLQSLGRAPRLIIGEAVYSGERGIMEYATMRALLGSENILKTAFGEIYARLFHISLLGGSNPETIRFLFKFYEVQDDV